MIKTLLRALVLVLVFPASVLAAGSVTVTTTAVSPNVVKYSVAWLSDSSGDVSSNPFDIQFGYILHVKTIPDTGGTQPTDLYDLLLNDANSVDLLDALAANLSQTTSKIFQLSTPLYIGEQIDVVVSNAGNAKTGTVIVWVRR